MDFFPFIFNGHDSEKHSKSLVASVSFPFYSETLHTQQTGTQKRWGTFKTRSKKFPLGKKNEKLTEYM